MSLRQRWMAFVLRLGKVQTAVVLFFTYFFVVGPVSVLMRLLVRRDLLDLRAPQTPSYGRVKRQIPTDPERCERQF